MNMEYYKIVKGHIIVDTYVATDVEDFLQKRDEVKAEGFDLLPISEAEYEMIEEKLEQQEFDSTPSSSESEFDLNSTIGKKLLILNFFRQVHVAPEVETLDKYYEWLNKE